MPGRTSARDCIMYDASQLLRRSLCIGAALALFASIPGCGPIATIAWLIHGPEMIPAEFDGLKGKRVAVVCLDANSLSGPGGEADAVGKAVTMLLTKNVHEIHMVRQGEVADWIDTHGGDITDYRDVGRGVKADM